MSQPPEHSLFADASNESSESPAKAPAGPFAGVAMEQGIDRVLTYSVPASLVASLKVGQRVRAPLGRRNRSAFGYVVSISESSPIARTKPLLGIDDSRVLLDANLMRLAMWMSRYYVCPLGGVIENIIPSAVKRRTGMGYLSMVRLAIAPEQAQEHLEKLRAGKRRAILARLLQQPPGSAIELSRLAGDANVAPATVRRLRATGWIAIEQIPDLPGFGDDAPPGTPAESPIQLTGDQERVLASLAPRLAGGFSVNLLHGVTGSGKTEVYLRCIRRVVDAGRQAIVLVPEIALTPQTVRRFTARFARVAVLHSGLSGTQRHKFWQQVSRGEAEVVIGARSAVFAPTPRLGIIVVDEEHEQSYKQDTAPRYHARDVAVKRAQLQDIPILLGSATPSLEMYWRVSSDSAISETGQGGAAGSAAAGSAAAPYALLRLPSRVRGLTMPQVEVIDLKQELRQRRGMHLFSQRLEKLLRQTIDAGKQAILLLNRRGYANFVHCPSCSHVMQCRYCDTTMTYHRTVGAAVHDGTFDRGVHTGQLHCHYCLAVNPLPGACPQCGKKLSLFGLGTQKVEEELGRKFPGVPFARVDSDTMKSARDYESALSAFGRGETRVLLGTQMIAKGLDYPDVTLVGVISGDTALALPDFRASERTFQLITQVAGRAGRGDTPGRVVLQTFQPDDPSIRLAVKQDYVSFAAQELEHRRQVGLPPFVRLVRIIIRDQDMEKLAGRAEAVWAALSSAGAGHDGRVNMKGPMPCAIARIAGYYRHQILLSSAEPKRLQEILAKLRADGGLSRGERVAVDVDPVSLL